MVIGWDIGGVNTKVARVDGDAIAAVRVRAFELQHAPQAMVALLRQLADEVGAAPEDRHAVTMTAELSQLFRTKREGVAFVLDAVAAAFPSADVRLFTVDGRFVTGDEARADPLKVGAANWSATAHQVARHRPNAILVDIGTTTTDVIPIVAGEVAARGWTDPERLASGELVYTGAVRTPADVMAASVPIGTATASLSAEGFALAGDVHLWRGALAEADYSCATPDGRPATRLHAGERLARVVCGDREMLDDEDISTIADALAHTQVSSVARAIRRVAARHPSLGTAVVTGLGAFIAEAAAREAGLGVEPLSAAIGDAAARCAPAVSVALLREREIRHQVEQNFVRRSSAASPALSHETRLFRGRLVDVVVKIGGGVLAHSGFLDRVLATLTGAARQRRVLVVPGGGPFADAVRGVDRGGRLSDSAAHWMAILAMDQYAHLLADRIANAMLVTDRDGIADATTSGRAAVLAPFQWLRGSDRLPHSWEVTSDSIAAWIAGELHAARLVLVKPPGAVGSDLVDAYFPRALPASVAFEIVSAERVDRLALALRGEAAV